MGFDISTSVVGLSCISATTSDKVYFLDHVKLDSKDSEYTKTKIVEKHLLNLKERYGLNIRNLVVEESAKMFATGMSSAQTLFKLSRFNALVSFIAQEVFSGGLLKEINVRSARAKLGIKIDPNDKTKTVKEKVRTVFIFLYPQFKSLVKKHLAKAGKYKGQEIPDHTSEDELDALIIALASQR